MDLTFDLGAAALAAGERFATVAREAASAAPGGHFARTQAAMAESARSAVFADALVGALRARIAEIKAATR